MGYLNSISKEFNYCINFYKTLMLWIFPYQYQILGISLVVDNKVVFSVPSIRILM